MQHHPFLHLFPHQLIYTADPIMFARRDSFYSALESIIDSVSCVLLDSKACPPQEEEKGSGKRVWGGGETHPGSFLDLEVLVVEARI